MKNNLLAFKLSILPDFLTTKYSTLYGGDVRSKVFESQKAFLMLLHSLGTGGGLGVSLRYVFDPGAPAGQGMTIYLIARNDIGIDQKKLSNIIENSPLGIFYPFKKAKKPGKFEPVELQSLPVGVLSTDSYEYAVEIIKEESSFESVLKNYQGYLDQTLLESPFHRVPYHVIYPFEPIADNDMTFLDKQFHSFDQAVTVEMTIVPTVITPEEAEAMTKILSKLEEVTSSGSISINTSVGQTPSLPKDVLAEMVQDKLREAQETAFTERFFLFSLRVFTDDSTYASYLADMVGISGNSNGRYRKFIFRKGEKEHTLISSASARVQPDSGIFWRDYWDKVPEEYKTLRAVKRLPRLAHIEEIAPFFRVMVPGIETLQTISLETETSFAGDGNEKTIFIGNDFFKPSREISITCEKLKKHMFVAGVPGSGKSTAIFNVLFQLYWNEIPFMVIEPAKTEYRIFKRLAAMDEAQAIKEDIDIDTFEVGQELGRNLRVYTMGNDLVSPLRFNPFEFPEGIGLYEHISNIESCFRGALPISTGPLPALLNEATEEIYKDLGWRGDDVADGSKPFPTMQDLYNKISQIFETKDYSADVKGDLKTAIEVRIGTLLRRNIGRIFNTSVSIPDMDTLMKQPVVLELDYLNEEQANLMTMFILSRVREYVRATRTSKSDLCHVIVIEEAHNIVGKTEGPGGEDQANPKAEATKYISRFLAEMRALGEGMIIADQLPSAVAPEVTKNTNIKLIHRLVSGDDREDIGMTMLLDQTQMEDLARLNPGESYLYQEGMYKPTRVNEIYIGNTFPVLSEPPPNQKELIGLLQDSEWWANGVFSEAGLIMNDYKKLYNEAKAEYDQLLLESKRVEMSGARGEEFRDIREALDSLRMMVTGRHDELVNRQVSFFQLMSQRGELCDRIAEEQFRPLLENAEITFWKFQGELDAFRTKLGNVKKLAATGNDKGQ
jgi:hypothetical protein